MTKRTDRTSAAARRGRQRVRATPPNAEETEAAQVTATEADVRWADVQLDEAARRVQAAEQQLAGAKRELAERERLHAKLSEAHELHASAQQTAQLVERRTLEAEQRARDATLAKEQARLATQRKQQAHEALKTVKERERAAKEAVAELQQSLSSSSSRSPSEASDE